MEGSTRTKLPLVREMSATSVVESMNFQGNTTFQLEIELNFRGLLCDLLDSNFLCNQVIFLIFFFYDIINDSQSDTDPRVIQKHQTVN